MNALPRLDAGSWHSPAYAGEPLVRLEAVAHFCLNKAWCLNIETKPTPGSESLTGTVVANVAARAAQAHLPCALQGGWLKTALRLSFMAVV